MTEKFDGYWYVPTSETEMWWMPVAYLCSGHFVAKRWTTAGLTFDSMWGMQFIISNLTVIALRYSEGIHVITTMMVIATMPIYHTVGSPTFILYNCPPQIGGLSLQVNKLEKASSKSAEWE